MKMNVKAKRSFSASDPFSRQKYKRKYFVNGWDTAYFHRLRHKIRYIVKVGAILQSAFLEFHTLACAAKFSFTPPIARTPLENLSSHSHIRAKGSSVMQTTSHHRQTSWRSIGLKDFLDNEHGIFLIESGSNPYSSVLMRMQDNAARAPL